MYGRQRSPTSSSSLRSFIFWSEAGDIFRFEVDELSWMRFSCSHIAPLMAMTQKRGFRVYNSKRETMTRGLHVFLPIVAVKGRKRLGRYLRLVGKLLHNMGFNSYAAFEARTSEACDAIYDGWYTNCTQAASAYEVPIRRLQTGQKVHEYPPIKLLQKSKRVEYTSILID